MKTIKITLYSVLAFALYIVGCTKIDDLPYYANGKAVTLSADKTSITPSAADSASKAVTFSWTDPQYASKSGTNRYILEIDSAGRNFTSPATKVVIGNLSIALTAAELNNIMLNNGFKLGTSYNMDFRVKSSYGNNNEQYISNVVRIAVTPYNDPSVLTSSNASLTLAIENADKAANTFNWSKPFTGYSGTISYTLQYDSAGKNFVTPTEVGIADISAGLLKSFTQSEMNEMALNSGIKGGTQGRVEYRIKAVTAQGATSFSNITMVLINSYVPLLRFYLPGGYQGSTGNGNDWDPGTAPEFVRDLRSGLLNNLYYLYIYLPANAEFKVTQGRSWDVNYGGTAGVLSQNGANFKVTTSGVYRISIDRKNMKYDIREGRMGFVGGATGAGWDPPSVFPNYGMGYAGKNLFVGISNFSTGGWKLIDNTSWNNGSNSVDETRSYGSTSAGGGTLEINGSNMPDIATAGKYRVIWDGRNADNVRYEISPATEMRLVGDGMNKAGVNDWDPASSPQMTYSGNGVWTITIALKASKEIKFLAGNAWGAFDYEDNAGQSQATGVAKAIKWEGGSNFKTPATAGTYTVTLNEYTQTMRID